uniref:Uncharacterized protein n=1 Tax=Corethron hystrix TaxID=216773 RepID=A0A6U5KZ95_9STRA
MDNRTPNDDPDSCYKDERHALCTHADYRTDLEAATVRRLLALPCEIQRALPHLNSPAEAEAHELLSRYTFECGADYFQERDRRGGTDLAAVATSAADAERGTADLHPIFVRMARANDARWRVPGKEGAAFDDRCWAIADRIMNAYLYGEDQRVAVAMQEDADDVDNFRQYFRDPQEYEQARHLLTRNDAMLDRDIFLHALENDDRDQLNERESALRKILEPFHVSEADFMKVMNNDMTFLDYHELEDVVARLTVESCDAVTNNLCHVTTSNVAPVQEGSSSSSCRRIVRSNEELVSLPPVISDPHQIIVAFEIPDHPPVVDFSITIVFQGMSTFRGYERGRIAVGLIKVCADKKYDVGFAPPHHQTLNTRDRFGTIHVLHRPYACPPIPPRTKFYVEVEGVADWTKYGLDVVSSTAEAPQVSLAREYVRCVDVDFELDAIDRRMEDIVLDVTLMERHIFACEDLIRNSEAEIRRCEVQIARCHKELEENKELRNMTMSEQRTYYQELEVRDLSFVYIR